MNKTILVLLATLLLTMGIAYADGMGIINNLNFGQVVRGGIYEKNIMFYPFSSTNTGNILVEITSEDPYATHIDFIEAPLNSYTYTTLTLNIPKNARKGCYRSLVCAIGTCNQEGICIRVGACTWLEYEVINKIKLK